jgi:hypothetical protein
MAEAVSRRGLLLRLTSRDLLVDTARGVAPLWRQVADLTRPEPVSVDAAVAALRARQRGVPAGAESAAGRSAAPCGAVPLAVRTQDTASTATGRP